MLAGYFFSKDRVLLLRWALMEWESIRARESPPLQRGSRVIQEDKGNRHLCPEMATTCQAQCYLYDAILALQRTRISDAEVKSKERLRDVA
jgi:hypothetical protein